MKKQTRFILFVFLVFLLLAVTAVAASAMNLEVATQNALSSALTSVKDNDVIIITQDLSLSKDIKLNAAKTYTLRGETPDVTVTLAAGSFLINDGNVTIENLCIVANAHNAIKIMGGKFNINSGTFIGATGDDSNALIYAAAGNLTFSGGTFTTKGNALFDIALSKENGDSFEITGGTYTLEDNGSKGGVLLRTRVGSTSEVNQEWHADPTKIFYLNDVDILLSGGTFIDQRMATTSLVDATVSNSKVVIGSDAVLLSRYAKSYIVDINNERSEAGEDIPFAQNTARIQYNGTYYYSYMTYEKNADTKYSPIMTDNVSAALVDNQPGLLFHSTIPSSVVAALQQNFGKHYTFGTLIAPAEYVAAAGGFTHAKLKEWGKKVPAYVDIRANESIIHQKDGSISFNGGLIYLKSCERAYAAVSYVYAGGKYYYSNYDMSKNAPTMVHVAKIEYTTTVESGYQSLYKPGAYSAYSREEQQLLKTYCQYNQMLTTATVTPATAVSFDGAGTNLQNKANALALTLGECGYTASGTPLLVGTTGETAKQALAEVEGYGYYIGVIDEQIVIAGSNDALTMLALSVFEAICKEANGKAFDLTEIVVSNVKMVVLNWETPIVYPHTRDTFAYNMLPQYISETPKLDNTPSYSTIKFMYSGKHLYNTEDNELTVVEYPLYAAMQIGKKLDGYFGYNSVYVPDSFAVSGSAIHVGLTDLARKFLRESEKDVGYYGYFVEDGKIVVTSYDDATLRLALKMFLEDLDDYALDVDGDGAGDFYAVPADCEFERGYNNGFTGAFDVIAGATGTGNVAEDVKQLVTAYPRPDTIVLSGTVNVSNGELELYYLDAKTDDYRSYCEKLQTQGYTVYMAERPVEGSYFVTYVNRSANNGKGIMLHVMYNAYKHASTQKISTQAGSKDTALDEMFTPTLRVISSTITDNISYVHHILPEKFLTKQQYTKITDSKLTVVQRQSEGRGCYIYTLEDGSFVVVDGGNNAEVEEFYYVLRELHKEAHGAYPSSAKPIRIAAWYLTHGHGDHVGLLNGFASYLKSSSYPVVLDGIITNFPSNDEIYDAHSINQKTLNKIGTTSWFKGTSEGRGVYVPYYNVHTGQRFYIGNLEFEVMFTPEDIHPWATGAFNDACTVIRLTVHAHDVKSGNTVYANTVASSKVSTMSLGDIYPRTSKSLRATYGDYLESEIMTMAHHGSGGEGALFQLINPQIILWQNTAKSMSSQISVSSTQIYKNENREMITYKYARWRYIISSYRLYSGTYNPTITFGADGVAGLGEASTPEEVWAEAQAFRDGLTNVYSTDALSYGDNYFIGFNGSKGAYGYDYSTGTQTSKIYNGEGYLLWRGNFFSSFNLP